ncbi:hypothetical protein [Rhizobium sp. AU243]|uniref:hypothetical protein n=1 Tax=Rhizobium sp. AU243 TaxID=2303425 RepID=UPI0010CB398E|nr:hypothetical protein [Rhizobium sp. AU243]
MRFSNLVDILSRNKLPSQWGEVPDGQGSVFFCLEDVNLRGLCVVEWEDAKPFFRIKLYYCSTLLFNFPIPIGLEGDLQNNIGVVIDGLVKQVAEKSPA